MSDRDAPSGAEAPGPGPETKAAPAAPADPGHATGNGASPAAGAPASRPAEPPPDADKTTPGEGSTPNPTPTSASSTPNAGSGDDGGGEGAPARKPRRRGSRGGRKRNKPRTEGNAQGATDGEDGAEDDGEDGGADQRSAATAATRTPSATKDGGGNAAADAATEANGDSDGGSADGAKSGRKRRNRGSRRSSDQAATERTGDEDGGDGTGDRTGDTTSTTESDPRTPELPDHPREGRPSSVKAAARALVPKIPPPRPKPQIGDSIPPEALRQGDDKDNKDNKDDKDGKNRKDRKDRKDAKQSDKKGQADAAGDGGRKRRRRRGGRGKGSGSRPEPTLPIEATLPEGFELDEATLERRKGRERKGRPVGRYSMSVHVSENATQIAVLEGRALIEHYVSRPSDDISQIHGNIYLGRVQNVLPGMEAAFVDIGTPKNAVLYRGDVHYDPEDVERRGQTPRIEDMLRAGQNIVCQVTKNPIGAKGARLTQEVSLPGRFVVLIPNSSTYGISKRLPDDERKRLRTILDRVKPAEHGIIVRTAAQNVTSDEIEDDVRRLAGQWKKIDALAKRSKAASLLYREPDMAVRVIREEFNQDYRNVAIDDPQLFEAVRDYVTSISPELADRVELYDPAKEALPLFERYHVHEQLHKALDRKVWLPSGGSLIIEHTEALTVIDVNTGKNVGRSSLEETVFKNNLEAAVEIARQLRLRDIGGIIVIDFIDMERKDNREEVVKVFRDALSRDKTRTQVFDISELGLCEMTRKRIGEGLLESFAQQCPVCEGRGVTIDEELLPT
jgi:ribonuclease E